MKNLILKYDGYIWGPFVHSLVRGEMSPSAIQCRFVSKTIFEITPSIPHQFLIDLKNIYGSFEIDKNTVRCGTFTIDVFVHAVGDEVKFMDECDFTCNLLDYRRDGLFLRTEPKCIAYDISPYETVIEHIKNKELVPVNTLKALENAKVYIENGWTSEFIKNECDSECPICHGTEGDLYFKLSCGHWSHISCLKKWITKNPTCPMCRKHV